ncbi:MAG: RibD family protein [Geminicoccaceae bacterium]
MAGNGTCGAARRVARRPGIMLVGSDEAWRLLLALRRRVDADGAARAGEVWSLRRDPKGWVSASGDTAELVIEPGRRLLRWRGCAPDPLADTIFDLHLEHALERRSPGRVIAMLGQSLDGFIATRDGASRYINGEESLVHLHRLRALSDAVLVGIGTALADEPRLTTRHVAGANAVRVVLDPRGRLPRRSGLLHDGAAPTLVLRGTTGAGGEERLTDQAVEVRLPAAGGSISPGAVIAALAARGLTRLLVEGGGVTVGRFLEAGMIDRIQLAVSPLILGSGRPALPVAPALRLDQALRPVSRAFGLGGDVLFDLRFARTAGDDAPIPEIC